MADAGPLGYREIAAHGHADALSFTLSVGGEEFLVDPGTYAYHTEGEWRSYFRGTSAHNTVRIDGMDQSQSGGNFMWLRKARALLRALEQQRHAGHVRGLARRLSRPRGSGDPSPADCLGQGRSQISIDDGLEMAGTHDVEIFFHCHEECTVRPFAGGVELARGDRAVRLCWPDADSAQVRLFEGSLDPIAGWVSRRFDRKHPAVTVAWKARLTGNHLLRTAIAC